MKFASATEQVYKDGDSSYFYWVVGNSDNPTLLLLPGYTGTHSDLLPLAESLKDTFFLIIPDLPGWGKSPRFRKRLTIGHYAIYLQRVMRSIHQKKFCVFGHCMGGTLALEYAIHFPDDVKKLIVVSTPYNEGLLSQRLFLHLADVSTHAPKFFRPLLFFWRSRAFSVPLAIFLLQFRSFRKKVRIILRGIRQQPGQKEDVVEENWISLVHYHYSKIKTLSMPILIVHGEKDLLVSPKQADRLHLLLPNAQLKFIENAGHIPPAETPGALASLIRKFLET